MVAAEAVMPAGPKQLKRLYRAITELEATVQQDDGNDKDEEAGIPGCGVVQVLKGKESGEY
ncbi:hypothetical protein BKA70DRAFT_1425899 [Coprinopsis sp. MPI-PUGE-AT-0042]|nr:hypothetical protein BKA70DRAFT_1425899 [Coprinopsis sp. MPI-PUGE-AT-0042]